MSAHQTTLGDASFADRSGRPGDPPGRTDGEGTYITIYRGGKWTHVLDALPPDADLAAAVAWTLRRGRELEPDDLVDALDEEGVINLEDGPAGEVADVR